MQPQNSLLSATGTAILLSAVRPGVLPRGEPVIDFTIPDASIDPNVHSWPDGARMT